MTSQERKRDKNQLNITVSPGTSAPENIRSHTHTALRFKKDTYKNQILLKLKQD
jgi:hypothetical protein